MLDHSRRVHESLVTSAEIRLLEMELKDCYLRAGVDHLTVCRPILVEMMKLQIGRGATPDFKGERANLKEQGTFQIAKEHHRNKL
jgi:hypothetical protein